MDINIRKRGTVHVIQLRGDMRLGEPVNDFASATDELLQSGEYRFVLDLEQVAMLDSSGIGALMKLLTSASKRGGAVKLVNPSAFAAKTLRLVGLLTLFQVFPDEEQALASFD